MNDDMREAMIEFSVYVNNGFHYEYFLTLRATSAYAARKEFKRLYAGDHRAEGFRVRCCA